MQLDIALSTIEAEHVTLSTAVKETILIMQLLQELKAAMIIDDANKSMKHTAFEDNNRAIEFAKTPKMRLCAKLIAIKHHYFYSFVEKGIMKIIEVDTHEEEADFLTKSSHAQLLTCLRKKVIGWL